jgi:hypothetical protein
MCRSIKTLRAPYAERVTDEDMHAAALQYVRKVSGFRAPAAHNADAFNEAVEAVTAATRTLLDQLEVRSAAAKASLPGYRPGEPGRAVPVRPAITPKWSPPLSRRCRFPSAWPAAGEPDATSACRSERSTI